MAAGLTAIGGGWNPAYGRKVALPAWSEILKKARDQKVYWNAWGGDTAFNQFMTSAADAVRQSYGVDTELVRLSSTSEAVSRVIAESESGNDDQGSVDMVWINGENFATLHQRQLLLGPIVEALPNSRLLDTRLSALTNYDATIPTDGYEAPWGRAQFGLYYDTAAWPNPPHSAQAFHEFSRSNPGRITYPAPPDFVGRTFLKQILYDLTADVGIFYKNAADVNSQAALRALWEYLDNLHPHLWRDGKGFVDTASAMVAMVDNREIAVGMSFNVGQAQLQASKGQLPSTAKVYFFQQGSIGNVNFLAIPFNARSVEGALVMINHLLSPAEQARRQDPSVWGDLSVLDIEALPDAEKALFAGFSPPSAMTIADFHPSWSSLIDDGWSQRYRS